jgi:hypothetical protein
MKTAEKIIFWTAIGTQAASVLMFGSSFFIKDNARAVKRRYWAVGVGAVGIGATIYLQHGIKVKIPVIVPAVK